MQVQEERDWYLDFKNPASRYKYPGSDMFSLPCGSVPDAARARIDSEPLEPFT
jgi:hypothetical protein